MTEANRWRVTCPGESLTTFHVSEDDALTWAEWGHACIAADQHRFEVTRGMPRPGARADERLALRDEERERFARLAKQAADRARLVEYDRTEALARLQAECDRDDGEGTHDELFDAAWQVLAAFGLGIPSIEG